MMTAARFASAFEGLLNPAFALALWFASHPFFPLLNEWGVPRPAYLVTAYLAVCLLRARGGRWPGLRFAPEDYVVAGLGALAFVSALGMPDIGPEEVLRYIAASFLVPWVGARLVSTDEASAFIRYLLVLSLLILVLTVGVMLNTDMWLPWFYREERIYVLPNWVLSGLVGLQLGVLTVICGGMILRPDSRVMRIAVGSSWALVALGLGTVVYLGARSVTVSIMAVLILLSLLATSKSLITRLAFAFFVVAVVLATLQLVPDSRSNYFAELLFPETAYNRAQLAAKELTKQPTAAERPSNDSAPRPAAATACRIEQDSIAIRLLLAREALRQFTSSPAFGIGFGRFGLESCFYAFKANFASPHNWLLHIAAELGLVGLALALALVALILWRLSSALRNSGEQAFVAWPLLGIWAITFARDQFFGSYHSLPHIYIVSGLVVATLARKTYKSTVHV